ncbi:hypothetical protein FQR65_LT17687 [Abscondita terminalis]|nr:hypothetical protein FQR65_LT17687 [Abscondita terminalis]
MIWLIILTILAVVIYYKGVRPLSYWKTRGVPHRKPIPILGNLGEVLLRRKAFFDHAREVYNEFSKERYFGYYQLVNPVIYIRDLDLIKRMTIKDFDYFTDHNGIITEDVEPLMGKTLFNLKGQKWRDMRATLTPSFTSSKMKMIFTLVSECAEEFVSYFEKQEDTQNEVEMKDVFTRFTNDVIASVAFGLKVNSMKEKTNEFYRMGQMATSITGIRFITFNMYIILPKIAKFLQLRILSLPAANFFKRIVTETIAQREKEGLSRPDMIQLLMEARKGKPVEDEADKSLDDTQKTNRLQILTDEDITAQALIFFFGGFETSSTLMTFIAYELAINPDIQKRLQKEIQDTLIKCDGKITYDALHNMKYMDMVVSEVLRKWPTGFVIDRLCLKDYKIEPIHPWEKPLTIEKGRLIQFSIVGLHYDPKYFPNPEKFDPERFSDENKNNIVPFSYLPFGSGPRSCIASRFALMENKLLIFHLLSKFDIVPTEKTSIPIKLIKNALNLHVVGGVWYFGLYQFTTPMLMIRDLDLIKKITVKDYEYFIDHNNLITETLEPLMGKNLLNLKGQRWRDMRATLSPSFTGSKMKMMFSLILECAEEFTQHFLKQNNQLIEVEMKDIFTRFTNDVIATTAFGLKCNSMEDKNNDFYLMGKSVTTFGASTFIKINFASAFPKLAKFLQLRILSKPAVSFFRGVIREALSKREKDGLVRPDMIHLLMEARKEQIKAADGNSKIVFTDDDITAQALIFFFGGFETSASLMTFIAYELALNQDIQKRLQNEIDETLNDCNGILTYEALHKMKYMDMVVSETLRKWPAGFAIDRLCVKDYVVNPVNAWEKHLVIEKGTIIQASVVGIHRDPQYFPNPEKFDPERFNDENKQNIEPFSYLPFGAGPRICIASRFALMENKILIFHLLSKFNLIKIDKTLYPMKLSGMTINIVPAEGIWLGIIMFWLIFISVLCALFYYKAIKPLSYWKDRGVVEIKPLPVLGNFASVSFQRISVFDQLIKWYFQFPKERYFGFHELVSPVLMIRDLDLIKRITIKDFDHFTDHNSFTTEEVEPLLGKNLFNLKGQRWRDMRATLSPSFTSSKMKIMFSLMSECAEEFVQYFRNQKDQLQEVEIRDIFTRFTNDVIATTAFGLKCNSLENKNNEFYLMGKKVTSFGASTIFKMSCASTCPKLAKFLQLRIVEKSAAEFFTKAINETIRKRKQEGLVRPDMIHLLMEAQKELIKTDDRKSRLVLTDEDIISQALIFFFGGFETASALMVFMAYELALNQDIQKRLQEEINETLKDGDGKLTYEALNKMKYLDMVVSETLRKWPPGFAIDRMCVKDYVVEPVHAWEKPLLIEKGTVIEVPIVGILRDPQYFPNPDKFDPERFSDENKHILDPSAYIPFGSGPRLCIASRFALMENKILMFHLLSKFNLLRIDKTLYPMEISKKNVNVTPAESVWLGMSQRH